MISYHFAIQDATLPPARAWPEAISIGGTVPRNGGSPSRGGPAIFRHHHWVSLHGRAVLRRTGIKQEFVFCRPPRLDHALCREGRELL